jgi:hypothetical protein
VLFLLLKALLMNEHPVTPEHAQSFRLLIRSLIYGGIVFAGVAFVAVLAMKLFLP